MKKQTMILLLAMVAVSFAQKNEKPEVQRESAPTKHIEIDVQKLIGEGWISPIIFGDNMEMADVDVELNRNFSEYLAQTVDRESIERGNHEN